MRVPTGVSPRRISVSSGAMTSRADESDARRLVEQMALALQGSLLVRWGHPEVADAFCASRLDPDHGLALGTLPLRAGPSGDRRCRGAETMTDPPVPAVIVEHRHPPSTLRLVAGVVALGLERLTDYAAALEARLAMVPGDTASDETRRATALAVGAILSLPDYARAALATTDRARRSVGRFTGPVTSLFSAVWPGSAVADRVDHLRLISRRRSNGS